MEGLHGPVHGGTKAVAATTATGGRRIAPRGRPWEERADEEAEGGVREEEDEGEQQEEGGQREGEQEQVQRLSSQRRHRRRTWRRGRSDNHGARGLLRLGRWRHVHVRDLGFVYVRSHLDPVSVSIVPGEGKGCRSHELPLTG